MGMADLKKSYSKQCNLTKIEVDDFIDDAENYAAGLPSLLFAPRIIPGCEKAGDSANAQALTAPRKNATFSLNEGVVEQLAHASKMNKVSKSKMVRILVYQFAKLSAQQQMQIVEQFISEG
ncbi:hypothetical protein [Catenovulum sediminis]|uniref:CopG family transcriptional regulator n=1 Tax=Catenovulum sediminis TaxID=1740262 RepID=A0ABV1RLQ6_9ALTE|nr:hypothetical protein [Catenovulum sediminis]